MYEGGINVPLIVAGASVPEASQGRESLALVASVDLFATMAEIGEVSADTIDALSILPFVADPDLPTTARRDYIYAEKFSPNGSGPYDSEERAVRGARYKLIWRDGVYEEFYDLDEDPLEDENLLPFDQLSGDEAAAYLELQSKMENVADGVPAPSTTTTTTTPETTTTTVAETTTTSSTTTTTTSTTIADSPCGDVDGNDVRTASDALGILRAALGLDVCPACVCDLDATGVITASDALGLLRYSVGSERGALSCPVCD